VRARGRWGILRMGMLHAASLADEREAFERTLCVMRARGDLRGAATAIVERYGAEIVGFLVAVLRDKQSAGDVFSQFTEDLWAGIGRFRGESSHRTWAYTLARNAAHRYRRDPLRRRGVALSECPELAAMEERVRTATVTYMRSEVKNTIRRLRDALDADDQMLLILRVDRGMAWNEVASVMLGAGPDGADGAPGAAEVARMSATLRKRFERVKDWLRAEAARATPPSA
jgi:RNA polymerase sigma-70 factor (ECF subfamily)